MPRRAKRKATGPRKRAKGSGSKDGKNYARVSWTIPRELDISLRRIAAADPQRPSVSTIATRFLEEKIFKTAEDLRMEEDAARALSDLEKDLPNDSAKGQGRDAGGDSPGRPRRRDTP